jgi:hypothetical protein
MDVEYALDGLPIPLTPLRCLWVGGIFPAPKNPVGLSPTGLGVSE